MLEQVGLVDVGLVADRGERRDALAEALQLLRDDDAERPTLAAHGDSPETRRHLREDASQSSIRIRVEYAEAVRPENPHPGAARDREQLSLPVTPGGADLRETGRYHRQYGDGFLGAGLGARQNGVGRRRHERQIDRLGDLSHTRVGMKTLHDPSVRVHGIDGSGERTDKVLKKAAGNRFSVRAGADHGDRARSEQLLEPGHGLNLDCGTTSPPRRAHGRAREPPAGARPRPGRSWRAPLACSCGSFRRSVDRRRFRHRRDTRRPRR